MTRRRVDTMPLSSPSEQPDAGGQPAHRLTLSAWINVRAQAALAWQRPRPPHRFEGIRNRSPSGQAARGRCLRSKSVWKMVVGNWRNEPSAKCSTTINRHREGSPQKRWRPRNGQRRLLFLTSRRRSVHGRWNPICELSVKSTETSFPLLTFNP